MKELLGSQLYNIVEEHEILNEGQHGFRSNRSTLTQLLEFYETIMKMSEVHTVVDAIYLDYAKAFDKVTPGLLLHKMGYLTPVAFNL